MSVQAGLWNFGHELADQELLLHMSEAVADFGPDGHGQWFHGAIGMIHRSFHTTSESRLEKQPHVTGLGTVVTWDGRLDNREELISSLDTGSIGNQADVEIAAAAYDRWGTDCFHRLIGDWAVSVWDSAEKTLVLARDYMGIRHLYYRLRNESVIWCTHLTPIVVLSGSKFVLSDEYVAGYLAEYPAADLTPYQEIRAVPAGGFVKVRNGIAWSHRYWSFEPKRTIRYKTDAEYEEHFRNVFRQAVRRRLRSESPVLAELSGGLDSSSIVCMADDILTHEGAQTPRVDTISYFDLSEPDGDDFPYFTSIEEKRGRTGFHIDTAALGSPIRLQYSGFVATPVPQINEQVKLARRNIVQNGGYRVSLSGSGGDEFTGQTADFRVQMADLILTLQVRELARQLKAWSLLLRRPWIQLLLGSFVQLLPLSVRVRFTKQVNIGNWIGSGIARRHDLARRLLGEAEGTRFCLPSVRDWVTTLAAVARRTAMEGQQAGEEIRYPYLDRDLIEFITSIPQNQLLRAGERRSLIRRAFAGLLPSRVLARRTKAGAARCFILMVESQWTELERVLETPIAARLGYINAPEFLGELRLIKDGKMPPYSFRLIRGLCLEVWLRHAAEAGVLAGQPPRVLQVALGDPGDARSSAPLPLRMQRDQMANRPGSLYMDSSAVITSASSVVKHGKKGGERNDLLQAGSRGIGQCK